MILVGPFQLRIFYDSKGKDLWVQRYKTVQLIKLCQSTQSHPLICMFILEGGCPQQPLLSVVNQGTALCPVTDQHAL